ncbi:MAG TPA: PadR family transcriptional regulator [Candidatus Limnocylindrales bacterium]|nr:PadR family transcriptional regulator [Candidatus Limnocylindrales bacterium]
MSAGNLRYAVLGLVSSKPEGIHGYRLKGECESIADEFWAMNYGRLYRILDLLERAGELTVTDEIQHGRPNRKVYRITEKGRQSLDDWLLQPVQDGATPLRDELVLKLLFLGTADIDRIYPMIVQQRRIYLTRLAQVTRRRRRLEKAGMDLNATGIIMDGAEMRVRADLSWLDMIERRLLRQS